MPRGDGTGPMGIGSMTGRAAGFCAGSRMPGYMNPGVGRGIGAGFLRGGWGCDSGRGWRNMFRATGMTGWQCAAWFVPEARREQQLQAMKDQAAWFENTLGVLRQRIEEIENDKRDDGK